MHHAKAMSQASLATIRQALSLIDQLDDAQYDQTQPPVFTSSTGSQIRHLIEYYQCFFRGLPAGSIDYEDRPRDARIATSREHAASVLQGLVQQLLDLPAEVMEQQVMTRVENGDCSEPAWCQSTVGRELDFLLSHTVHHLAIIALMLRSLGLQTSDDLGMAPSTTRHLQRNGSCAR